MLNIKLEGWHGRRNIEMAYSLAGGSNRLYTGDDAGHLWRVDSREGSERGFCWWLHRGKVTCVEVNVAGE